MLKVKLITVGNLKEKYWKDAVAEYQKRLQRYVQLEIVELKEERIKEQPSKVEIQQALDKEAVQIMKRVASDDYVVCLAIKGRSFSSEQLAEELAKFEQFGKKVIFIIGSSHGLANSIYQRTNLQVSFSRMTFPHQMMRVIFLEQLYRGYKILKNENYHK